VDDNQGLFSECSGFVSNLTINGVSINAGSVNYVGAISGNGGTIRNCRVILGGTSILVGCDYVGGISGNGASVSGCTVESSQSTAVIKGSRYVGGIVGSEGSTDNIDNSRVKCIILGLGAVGGIAGCAYGGDFKNCSYEGTIMGENEVGGMIGVSYGYSIVIEGCKVDATVTASNGNAGGLVGGTNNSYSPTVYGCYSAGTISATGTASGLATSSITLLAYLSYSTMTSTSSTFYGLGNRVRGEDCATISPTDSKSSGTNIKTNCTDITTFLRECYSQYASYWNFGKSWIWQGSVGGSQVNVNCPRLSWE
jgi:hypothetical protein